MDISQCRDIICTLCQSLTCQLLSPPVFPHLLQTFPYFFPPQKSKQGKYKIQNFKYKISNTNTKFWNTNTNTTWELLSPPVFPYFLQRFPPLQNSTQIHNTESQIQIPFQNSTKIQIQRSFNVNANSLPSLVVHNSIETATFPENINSAAVKSHKNSKSIQRKYKYCQYFLFPLFNQHLI